MAIYKNKELENIDTFRTNTVGVLSGKVGHLRPQEQFNANDLGRVLQITSGEDKGRYVYTGQCALISSTPLPEEPIPVDEYVLHIKDGVVRKFIPE